ncbi:hypothetical protein GQ53DRAFT_762248 [Thozetella sp. PMI_491]|nr:hypothetical protein GQ53DRAFT_762248 [Thozetella sp. PMI_491]
MRFATASVVLAGAVAAHNKGSIVYSTDYVTITSCGPEVTNCPAKTYSSEVPLTTSTVFATTTRTITSCAATVTNCPAHSTVVVTETIPVSTTVCPVTETETPSSKPPHNYGNSTTPVVPKTSTGVTLATSKPVTTPASVCVPSKSVKTISTSVTTVIPTVYYETVDVPCPTKSAPSSGPSGSANSTSSTPKPSGTQVVTAGAASLAGSAAFAVVAGAVALLL